MKILVTGGAGFLGQPVVRQLEARRHEVFVPRSKDYDLTTPTGILAALYDSHAEGVVHLAARVGGIGANAAHPGQFFYENAFMGIELMEQARRAGVRKFLVVGTGCAYPADCLTPQREDDIWDGYPAAETAPYAMAKKMLLVQAQAYRREYGFDAVYMIPTNLYGPGDSFDLETGHVVPSIIRKVSEAKFSQDPAVQLWGTGKATRDFLYVEDAARGIADAFGHYSSPDPVNLGSGVETSIRDLAYKIADIYRYDGDIVFDPDRPDGQPRRLLDTERAQHYLGFKPRTLLEQGLIRTVNWFEDTLRTVL